MPAYRLSFGEDIRMSKREHHYSIKFNRIEQEKIEFRRMEDQRSEKYKMITNLNSLGVAVSKAEVFLGPFEGFCLFSFRYIRIVQSETFHFPADIGSVTFVEI